VRKPQDQLSPTWPAAAWGSHQAITLALRTRACQRAGQ
jgi:hypothetical protein